MNSLEDKENLTLAKFYGKKGNIITTALIMSFVCNILALTMPFTEVGHFLGTPLSCTLPYSVYLMWVQGLYWIAILIVVFSIMFPFAKLAILSYIWIFAKDSKRRHKFLTIVEPLGKWSMLDVFATCIILILCSKQILIYGLPRIGVNFFLIAIFLSMGASIGISHLHEKNGNLNAVNGRINIIYSLSKFSKTLLFLILLLSFSALILALFFPYIEISSFLLINYQYSLLGSVLSLAVSTLVLSIFMFCTLILFPVLHILTILIYLIKSFKNDKAYPGLFKWMKIFSRFNMLDVFLLAFIIFITEGETLIKTHEKEGLYLICLFIFTCTLLPYILTIIKKYLISKIK